MRRITPLTGIISLLIALPLGFLLLYPVVVRCLFISFSTDFQLIQNGKNRLYVSQLTPAHQQQQVLKNDTIASDRIRAFWGDKQGRATLIYCHTATQYADYCGGGDSESSAGCSLGTPWGASFLVIGPDGNNPDVIAHERCHDELLARVGWWRTNRQIPQWFNEGLALMVDYRFTNPKANPQQRARDFRDEWEYRAYGRQMALSLEELETMRGFFGGDYHHVMLAYYTGAAEVSRWLAKGGNKAPATLARRVGEGQEFGEVYGKSLN
jgi:hypothetical protein